jgi:hypothetical protein
MINAKGKLGVVRRTDKIVRIILALIVGICPCAGTTIIAVHTHGQVLLAADGLITYEIGNKTWTGGGCKIVHTASCAFAARGVLLQTAAHFNLQNLGLEACRSAGDIADVVANFSNLAREPVLKGLGAVKADEPELYRRDVLNQPAIEVVFAGYNSNHRPTAIIKRYQVDASNRVDEPSPQVLSLSGAKGAIAVAYAGEYAAIKGFLAKNPSWIDETPPLEVARKLLELEIGSKAPGVGPPIAILKLTTDGLDWVDRGACEEQTSKSPHGF